MNRLSILEQKVRAAYEKKAVNRDDWADYLYQNHVFWVVRKARELAERYGADIELSQAAAMLHDIADAVTSRFDESHEEKSLEIARELMRASGYNEDEIATTVDDAIKYHSCHDGHIPKSLEGKVLATADALFHLQTDFYIYVAWVRGREGATLAAAKDFTLKKLDRDFHNKILFDEIKQEVRNDYEDLKKVFSKPSGQADSSEMDL